jgi:pilus assembly protein Flp/PilA
MGPDNGIRLASWAGHSRLRHASTLLSPFARRQEFRLGRNTFFTLFGLFFEKVFHMLRKIAKNRKGQGLVEYGLIIAGVALICAAAISVFGHKTSDLIAAVATVLPGAHAEDNGPMTSGKLIETTEAEDGPITLDVAGIAGNADTSRLGNNVLGNDPGNFGGLIVD